MKAVTRILVVSLCMFLVSGCWDRREVNDIAIVIAMAMDKEPDGRYRLSIQVPLVSSLGAQSGGGGGTSGDKSYYVDSAVGRTIREANGLIQARMSREIYYSHHRMIVIGEELAKDGMSDVLDIVARFPENRLTAYIVMTKGKAIELLTAQPQFERFSGEAMRELVKMGGINVTLKDVAQMLGTPGVDAILPVLTAVDSYPKGKSKEIEATGVGLFRQDKLVTIAKPKELLGLRLFQRDFTPFSIVVSLTKQERLTITLSKGRANIKPVVRKGHIHFKIDLYASAVVVENQSNLDLEEEKNIRMLQAKLVEQINNGVNHMMQTIKRKQSDFIGLGIALSRNNPREWRDRYWNRWNEELPKITYEIRSKVNLVNVGQTTKNITKGEDDHE
ncbi:Ger(x)C family spore germination protein [Brevibacillus formosus]|uniref:Ger(x)C family spore germination protein n=1 Tax=Brevibacillus TaxID=55080 RepID=UPI000D11312D|nr:MULTISPECIES: Ger(x)C family spore germination protein [Brevibacillus]MBG9945026.1 spore gernimation protein [Brevibacillus formosus]MED1947548.1 Ger(x)C family spore germination protein [Brevibacillus formosus]MED1997185.1 Ger(x)C family spore germination protein [Brevibacillus formosus]MED2083042.1 Ger(x)C family spore germination protein [Brevibacillus formosus]PSK20077.1 Ger(x)C family spore germination protein [Brevibacillus sp. NRRL NRS-603]